VVGYGDLVSAAMEFHRAASSITCTSASGTWRRSKRFYRAALEALGLSLTREGESAFVADELYVSADREPTSGMHIAFQAADHDAVQRFYDAGPRRRRPRQRGPASAAITRATTPRTCSIRMVSFEH
jgi:hypothetical protein